MYKTNTPNYKTQNVTNFSDFIDSIESEKEELKKVKRSIDPNSPDKQQYPRNTKYRYNSITRKMNDDSLPEIDDTLDNIEELEESVNDVNAMKRYLEDYYRSHSAFEKRGMDEGVEILRSSDSIKEAIAKIDKKIAKWESKEKGDLLPEEHRKDIAKGLKDLKVNLESRLVTESHINDDVYLKLTKTSAFKELVKKFGEATQDFIIAVDDLYDEGDNDDYMALEATLQEAFNTAVNM